jgi:serine phosphatase RsbU (regulator of sigma subunit)
MQWMGLPRAAGEGVGQPLTALSGLAGGWDDVRPLLEAAREELRADEAALLLLDASGTMLTPVVACGLDTPIHSGFRVPVGAGFAGRVAASGRPLILSDVNPGTVLNPSLHRRGIRALLGVPVVGRLGMLGVMHVGSVTPREFTAEETARLEKVASELSDEVLRRRVSEEHIAALALQRSLLPAISPWIDGLDISARYIPADGDLGGDWYDVFRLPDDRIGLVMGDVAGHGLGSAVVMGRLRSALRAYALEHLDPAVVLRLLDMKISYFEAGAVATVLYAVAEPPYDCFHVSSAGHLPPHLVTVDGVASAADVAPDPPLGVASLDGVWARHSTKVDLPVGGSLCLFTDGLVERRPTSNGGNIDQISDGLSRLLTVLRPGSADAACTTILNELVGEDITEDDIAVLVLRRLAPPASS